MLPVFERNKTLKKFILKRIYTAFIVVLFVVALNFFIIKLAPGDPVNIMAGFDNPSEEFKAAIRTKYNLDKPLITQFFTYIYRLIQGDLGNSYYSNQPVTSLLASIRYKCYSCFYNGNVLGTGGWKKRKQMAG